MLFEILSIGQQLAFESILLTHLTFQEICIEWWTLTEKVFAFCNENGCELIAVHNWLVEEGAGRNEMAVQHALIVHCSMHSSFRLWNTHNKYLIIIAEYLRSTSREVRRFSHEKLHTIRIKLNMNSVRVNSDVYQYVGIPLWPNRHDCVKNGCWTFILPASVT